MVKRQAQLMRRDQEAEPPLPEELSNIQLPRTIDIEAFRHARGLELEHFLKVLRVKTAQRGNKLAFQLLPKHMRRRAMSHNAYRIPARVRVLNQSKAQLKSCCRKRRRHTTQLLADYQRRNREFKWLETHIWHTKRMRMAKIWGWSLPVRPNEKSLRAVYRFARTECVLYDSSYYSAFRLAPPSTASAKLQEAFVATVPVEVFSLPSAQVYLVHPAGAEQVRAVLQPCEELTFQFTLFRLRGPKSALVLWKVLSIEEPHIRELLYASSVFNYIGAKDKSVYEFTATVPSQRGPQPKVGRQFYGHAPSLVPPQPDFQLILNIDNYQGAHSFWNLLVPNNITSNVPVKLTRRTKRSTYPHKVYQTQKSTQKTEKVKPDAIIEEYPEEAKQEAKQEEVKQEEAKQEEAKEEEPIGESIADNIEDSIEERITEEARTVKGLLVYRKGALATSFGDGWDCYLPAGHAMQFWRALVFAGGKVISLRDYDSLLLEQGLRSFPRDYPGTAAHIAYFDSIFKEYIEAYFRKPPAKRVNYFKLAFPITRFLDWAKIPFTEMQLVQVKADCKSPKDFAMLFQATAEDLRSGNKPTHTEPTHEAPEQAAFELIKDVRPSREVVGFVTSACLSFVRGKGYALGYLLPGSLPVQEALFRNHSSRHYHKCKVLLHK